MIVADASHLEVRVAVLEAQVGRIISDIESEKGTRARVNSEIGAQLVAIDERQRKLERIIYMGLGGLAVIEVLVGWYKH